MSMHDEDYRSASDDVSEYFADTVVYRDPVIQPVTVAAIVHPERSSRRKNESGGYDMVRVRHVYLFDHGDPHVDDVREDATIEADGIKYRVESSARQTGGRIMCKLIRAARVEVSRSRRGRL